MRAHSFFALGSSKTIRGANFKKEFGAEYHPEKAVQYGLSFCIPRVRIKGREK